jgi:hypothetical protein
MEQHTKSDSSNIECVFISDFYKSDLNNKGGAENNDSVLLSSLRTRGVEVEEVYCQDATPSFIEKNKNKKFIISNFIKLTEESKHSLKDKFYLIYEHDHKYLKTRDPSKYANFLAPPDHTLNNEFYKNAASVVCLSKIQAECVKNNLKITNVDNIGCSLWSKEKLDFISSISTTEKQKDYCIVNSRNVVKGTKQAVSFCQRSDYEFDFIESSIEEEFLKKMASYQTLVYIPTVLESLCRLVVEAKMLNCGVITKIQMLGAASEEWWSLNGEPLISAIRQKNEDAINLFIDILQRPLSNSHPKDVTVILNCYRRPEYLESQIAAIRKQTVQPKEIWLWVNYHEDNKNIDFKSFGVDKVFHNDYNWKFYGRFAGALLSRTKYIAMFDDDTIPGNRWLENCLQTMKTHEGILGGAGVILKDDKYVGHDRYGWSSQNEEIVEVDLVGHAWFFKTEWLQYLWKERPFTWENGEDIQFSYLAQKYGKIKTYCPPHPISNPEAHSSLKGYELGVDSKATSAARNHEIFYKQRNACVKNAIDNGWKTVQMKV